MKSMQIDKSDVIADRAGKEIYKFWNSLPTQIQHHIETISLEELLVKVISVYQLVTTKDVYHLFQVTRLFPGSYIMNISGMPILYIKKYQKSKEAR